MNDLLPAKLPAAWKDRQCNIRQFVSTMNARTQPLKVMNVVESIGSTDPGAINMAAEWREKDSRVYGCDVQITWYLNPTTNRVQWTPAMWNRRRFYWHQMLMHELIHRHQPSGIAGDDAIGVRQYRPTAVSAASKELQEYHGRFDEIEAYAHDTALEFFVHWPTATLREATKLAMDVHPPASEPGVQLYHRIFESDPNHPALLHYRRKVESWFDFIHSKPDFYQGLELAKAF